MGPIIRRLLFVIAACLTASAGASEYRLETWAEGLDLPWSIAFLSDNTALVTELGGNLRRIDASGTPGMPMENIPQVYFAGQGGLFDVVLHPDFLENQLVYLSFAEGDKKFVYLPKDEGEPEKREVKVGGTDLKRVEILIGLAEGDKVLQNKT